MRRDALLLAPALLAFLVGVWLPLAQLSSDFREAFALAAALSHGIAPQAQAAWVAHCEAGRCVAFPSPLPPSLALLVLPLVPLGEDAATLVWSGLQVASLLAGCLLGQALLGLRPRLWLGLLGGAALVLGTDARSDLLYGNFTLPQLALVLGAWRLRQTGRPGRAGVLLALGLLIRPNVEMLAAGLWPLALRDWRMLRGLVATCLVAVLAVVAVARPAAWLLWPSGIDAARAIWPAGMVPASAGPLVVAVLLMVGLGLALRARPPGLALAVLVFCGLLAGRLTWHEYGAMAPVAWLGIAMRMHAMQSASRRETSQCESSYSRTLRCSGPSAASRSRASLRSAQPH